MFQKTVKLRSLFSKAFFAFFIAILGPMSVRAGEMRMLRGHVPAAALLQPLGRLPATNSLRLAISLSLRNREALTNFLQRLYDPASSDYHQYLTPAQFNDRFGPTAQDYQTVIQFARTNGFEVVGTHDSRMLLDIQGKVLDVEKAFHVTLRRYQHPTENRQFYAPDIESSVDAGLPILDVVGLSDYAVPRPMLHLKPGNAKPVSASGSQASGYYLGRDFRNAYVPGVNLTGAGQTVGLLELDGYYSNDITAYETLAGLPNVPLRNSNVDNYTGPPGSGVVEVSLDIEMALAMAPGLAAVVVFQAGQNTGVTGFHDIFDSMASSANIKQFSSSWGFTGTTDPDTTVDGWLQKMQTQGQSFYQASGDGDAWVNPIWVPADSPYLTSVGGASLTMNGSGVSFSSETVWNEGNQGASKAWSPNGNGYIGSGGGVSTVYSIPSWQTNAINSTNHGSATMRNIPDVALTGYDIWVIYGNGSSGAVGGTSCAAPLWAGFTALVNQQAAAGGGPTIGFINPAIYSIGRGTNYASSFHDITTGNNINAQSGNLYSANAGFDLCTGWGTPNGAGLINALSPEPLVVTPSSGFVSTGAFGGPFSVTNQDFTLTNIAPASLNWSLVNTSLWLAASSSNGTLTFGGAAIVSVGLNSAAANLTAGSHTNSVLFSNLNDTVAQSRQFILTISKAIPALIWNNPAAITYGTVLSSIQLDATANVPGSFVYVPAAGKVLNTGTNILSAIFTPTDTTDYNSVTGYVGVVVSPAPLSVRANNATRQYGAANPVFTGTITGLKNGDNITATYSSSATTNSGPGTYSIVPSLVDPGNRRTNYIVSLTNGTLTVTMISPVVSWTTPSPITYGTALSSSQLDATANVPGNFAYNPTAGAVLPPGANTLSVLFTPSNMVDYSNATDSVSLVISVAPIALNIHLGSNDVVLTWNDPDSVFALQTAPAVTAVFTNVPGAASPHTNAITPAQQYFRLMEN